MFIVGGGTASAARKPMDRDKALSTLNTNFQYDKVELGQYLDKGLSYMELKNICLHAYAAKKPLQEVAQLRETVRLWLNTTSKTERFPMLITFAVCRIRVFRTQ